MVSPSLRNGEFSGWRIALPELRRRLLRRMVMKGLKRRRRGERTECEIMFDILYR